MDTHTPLPFSCLGYCSHHPAVKNIDHYQLTALYSRRIALNVRAGPPPGSVLPIGGLMVNHRLLPGYIRLCHSFQFGATEGPF